MCWFCEGKLVTISPNDWRAKSNSVRTSSCHSPRSSFHSLNPSESRLKATRRIHVERFVSEHGVDRAFVRPSSPPFPKRDLALQTNPVTSSARPCKASKARNRVGPQPRDFEGSLTSAFSIELFESHRAETSSRLPAAVNPRKRNSPRSSRNLSAARRCSW